MSRGGLAAALALSPLLAACASDSAAPTTLRVSLATIHAAALVAPRGSSRGAARGASSAADRPYVVVSVVGPGARTAIVRAPESGQLSIHLDEVLRDRRLTDLRIVPGDTVRILLTLLEGETAAGADSTAMAAASVPNAPDAAVARTLASALGPLATSGTRWLGAASLRLTDERGIVYWHGLDCVATCAVLSGSSDTPFRAPGAEPNVGTVELSGGGAKYHVTLSVRQL